MKKISVKETVKASWELTKKNIWLLVGSMVVSIILLGAYDRFGIKIDTHSLLGSSAYRIGLFLLQSAISWWWIWISLAIVRAKTIDWPSFRLTLLRILPYLVASLLAQILVTLGLILLIVPGIIVFTMIMFYGFVLMDKDIGPIDALQESAATTKGHRKFLTLLLLTLTGLNILGVLAVFVGLILSISVSTIAMALTYEHLRKRLAEERANEEQPEVIPKPILTQANLPTVVASTK